MRRLSDTEIEIYLAGSHQAVLSLSRAKRGPVAIPMSFLFEDSRFWIITSPDSDHGRLMRSAGRATLTVHEEDNQPRTITQWYVTAEGPIQFVDTDPAALLRSILEKDRGTEFVDEWFTQSIQSVLPVAVLAPERLAGYIGVSRLD